MVLLESLEIPLGTKMPDFRLTDPHNQIHDSNQQYGDKGLLVAFTCNHCPYAQAVWPRIIRLAAHAKGLAINTIAVNPNIHPNYPEDSPAAMKEKIEEWGIDFPYLVDETQQTAEAFKAQCTPDIYLFDAHHELVYHGRIDDNWQNESAVTSEELKQAIENLASGKPIAENQHPSMGCSIKWRS